MDLTGLLTLNDDCLLHILRFISRKDLCSIKDTCKRLRGLADQCFKLYGDKCLLINNTNMFDQLRVLVHFGKFIKSLGLNASYYNETPNILEMVARYTGEKLKAISLSGNAYVPLCEQKLPAPQEEAFMLLTSILKNIDRIEMKPSLFYIYPYDLLNCCENLKEVGIYCSLVDVPNSDWCLKNPNVTKLCAAGLKCNYLREICAKLQQLECLRLDFVLRENIQFFGLNRLSSTLKELKIDGSYGNYIERELQQFAEKTILKEITLTLMCIDEPLANLLGDFPNLTHLTFDEGCSFDENVLEILAERLVNIESLNFKACDLLTFKQVLKLIGNWFNLKTLSVDDCPQILFILRHEYMSLREMSNLQIYLDRCTFDRTCDQIGNGRLGNVRIRRID